MLIRRCWFSSTAILGCSEADPDAVNSSTLPKDRSYAGGPSPSAALSVGSL